MVVYGIAKESRYLEDGTFQIKTRIPDMHGNPEVEKQVGRISSTITKDEDLPWIQSILLPKAVESGDIVVLESINSAYSSWIVIGLTGAKEK